MSDQEFRITFGVRYNHEQHNLLPGITGEHYVTVIAADANQCREIVQSQIADRWAFDYPKGELSWDADQWAKSCPKGEFARWDISTPRALIRYRSVKVRAVVEYARDFPASEICTFIGVNADELAAMTDLEVNTALAERRDDLAERLETYLEGFTISTVRVPV